MTIADKLIPAFYVVDIEGSAASLEQLIGSKHKIKRISMASRDMANDLEACAAMDKVVDAFMGNVVTDQLLINPDFFPSAPAIEITPEMEELEARMAQASEAMEDTESNAIAVAITRRFDDWGDFVAIKREVNGEDFKIKAKVAVHPRRYVLEKSNEKQEHLERLHGQKLGSRPIVLH